jgi:HK97 gp10 family phage protein
VKFRGVDKLKRKLRAIPQIAREEIHVALQQSAAEMADTAKNFAPVKSGTLRNSIGYTSGAYKAENANVRGVGGGGKLNDKDLTVTIHAGDAKAYYAAFVEFGTAPHTNKGKFAGSHNPGASARPFFFPAYRLVKKRVTSKISRATSRAAKKVAAS